MSKAIGHTDGFFCLANPIVGSYGLVAVAPLTTLAIGLF